MQKKYTVRDKCRNCQTPLSQGVPFVNLGTSPLADKFVETKGAQEETFPLEVKVCSNCHLVQLVDEVDKDLLYGSDYGFFTGASPSSIAYFKKYADDVMARFPDKLQYVVEIASNDGTLLKHFQGKAQKILGIDPTSNTAEIAEKQGVPTLVEHFCYSVALKNFEKEKATIVMANNVLAHVDFLYDFAMSIRKMLADDGVAIIEFQYFPHLLFNNAFDHIYHEHRSFFSFSPVVRLFNNLNMQVFDVQEADTQGGSLRIFVRHNKGEETEPSVDELFAYEKEVGLNNLDTYKGFQARVDYIKHNLLKTLKKLKAEGKTIYGFGASAKGATLLNYCGIGTDLLDYIVDKTPYKFGKFSPGTQIPIVSGENLPLPDYYLLLVWNYKAGVLEREKAFLRHGGQFIVPIPYVHIV